MVKPWCRALMELTFTTEVPQPRENKHLLLDGRECFPTSNSWKLAELMVLRVRNIEGNHRDKIQTEILMVFIAIFFLL